MNKWQYPNPEYKGRTINTGPTLDGSILDMQICIDYTGDINHLSQAIALDTHIIPLILRAPEMREALHSARQYLIDRLNEIEFDQFLYDLIEQIGDLTRPTPQELYYQTGSYE